MTAYNYTWEDEIEEQEVDYSDPTVIKFIESFRQFNPEVVEDLFTRGKCYWFAFILYTRFKPYSGLCQIMYDQLDGHFACLIEDQLYDITGNITPTYYTKLWSSWESLQKEEPNLGKRITRDCIL